MKLFKKKESKCCCGGNCNDETMGTAAQNQSEGARIKVLGPGCAKCETLGAHVSEALETLGLSDVVEHVSDFAAIASYGVMSTPALVVQGKVVSLGKVLSVEEAMSLLQAELM